MFDSEYFDYECFAVRTIDYFGMCAFPLIYCVFVYAGGQ